MKLANRIINALCGIALLGLLTYFSLAAGRVADAQTWTVEVHRKAPREVVICSVLPSNVAVGGGDNCDFHDHPDPVYCTVFTHVRECLHPDRLVNDCGTTFGCQHLRAKLVRQRGKWVARPAAANESSVKQ